MRLEITVTLDGGGTVTVKGEDLNAEDVNEIFRLLAGYTVEATPDLDDLDRE